VRGKVNPSPFPVQCCSLCVPHSCPPTPTWHLGCPAPLLCHSLQVPVRCHHALMSRVSQGTSNIPPHPPP
jgi:hypothetical protein